MCIRDSHLAEKAGVTLCKEGVMNHRKNAKNAGNAPSKNLTHTHVYNKVDNEEPDESEELQDGSDPNQPLPSFTEAAVSYTHLISCSIYEANITICSNK